MSAEPKRDETERFPCFTIGRPHSAATKALAVDTFKVFMPSPPVPHESANNVSGEEKGTAQSLKVCTRAAISADVSPLTFRAIRIPAIVAGCISPLNICLNNFRQSENDKPSPLYNVSINCFIGYSPFYYS